MGPSGCGKTTLLDVLTGRRKYEPTNEDVSEIKQTFYNISIHLTPCIANVFQEGIFINGIPMENVRERYTANTGYVLQLATPYYEELTVRENLTLAAQMKLSSSMKREERFKRVEQVMQVVCD